MKTGVHQPSAARGTSSARRHARSTLPRWLLAALMGALVGCGALSWKQKLPVAESSEEIGNVYVSAYPVVAWSDISASLAPNRDWKITDAQTQALNVTSAQSLQVASSLAASLGITLPSGSSSATATTPAASSSAGAGSSVATVSAPSLPAASQAPTLPALATLSGLTAADGAQLLVASTALFQQAAILDNQITYQFLPVGYAAHLVTFQVNLQPSRRDWSYNALIDITLIPAPLPAAVAASKGVSPYSGGLAPVIIKPLIITDALETSTSARSIDQLRQALAQISGAVAHTGIGAFFGANQSSLQTAAGYTNNSVVTAGIVDDATIRVRLGAESDGWGNLVLVPRTYNISVMVLTRSGDLTDGAPGIEQLEAITHTQFSPTQQTPGKSTYLRTLRSRSELAAQVYKSVRYYQYHAFEHECWTLAPERPVTDPSFSKKSPQDIDTYLDFLQFITHGDYASIRNCLRISDADTVAEQERMYRLLADLSELQVPARYSRLVIPLKTDGTPRLPDPAQYALVSDSGDGTQETVTLVGGRNLRVDQLFPRALLTQNAKAWVLPTNVAVSTSTQPTLSMTFTAPTALKALSAKSTTTVTPPSDANTDQWSRIEIVLGRDTGQGCGTPAHQCYTNFLKVSAATPTSPSSPSESATPAVCKSSALPVLKAAASSLRPTKVVTGEYTANVTVAVSDLKKFSADCVTATGNNQSTPLFQSPFNLVVANAEVARIQTLTGSGDCASLIDNQVQLSATGKCLARLTLDDLVDGSSVSLSVVDSAGKTLPGPPLLLGVVHVDSGH